MLERVRPVREVWDHNKYTKQRKIVELALHHNGRNLRLIEKSMLNGSSASIHAIYKALGESLSLPKAPEKDMLPFSRDISEAWLKTEVKDLQEAGVPEAFCSTGRRARMFFGTEILDLATNTVKNIFRLNRYKIIKLFLDGEIDFEAMENKLRKADRYLQQISVNTDGSVFYQRAGHKPEQIADIGSTMEAVVQEIDKKLADLTRRLAIGFYTGI